MFLELPNNLRIFIATGYTTHKALGVRVSATRKEEDMRAGFDEAERNLEKQVEVVTSDAHTATLKMTKNLNCPITHVIHRPTKC